MNTTTPNTATADPDVPLPAGATTDGWTSVNPDGTLVRSLEWSRHDTGNVGVSIDGWQDATGADARGISFYGVSEGKSITADEARELAGALIEAGRELDRLDGAFPVDSATRKCCGGIGRHSRDCTTNENIIVICDEPDEKIEVVCAPFEPDYPGYEGEKLLSLNYRGVEETFVVLTAEQAARLAQLLTGQVEVSR